MYILGRFVSSLQSERQEAIAINTVGPDMNCAQKCSRSLSSGFDFWNVGTASAPLIPHKLFLFIFVE